MPLNLSQETQALLCSHLTGKPIGKRKFSATAIDGISCTGFSPSLVLLGSLPKVFRRTVASLVLQHIVSHKLGLCLAPVVQTCWLITEESYTQMLREKDFVQSFPGTSLKRIFVKNKVRALRFSTGALRVFWCTKRFEFGRLVWQSCSWRYWGKKYLWYHQWGRTESLLNINTAGGDLSNQANKTHRDQPPIYHSQIFTRLSLFSSYCLFFWEDCKVKSECRESHFMAPTHEYCSQQLKFTFAKGSAFRWLQAVPNPYRCHLFWGSHLEVRV